MNWHGVLAIYRFEMARARRTLWQSLVTPVITTSLYFIVFGAAIGSRMSEIDSVPYGAFIVPGLIMLSLFTESLSNASFGIWANGFEQLQFIPMLVITPLTFLGGAFYSIDMLPPAWRTFSLFNPVVYLISGFRWSFYGTSEVGVVLSLAMTLVFFALCLGAVVWIFRTGYRLKS